MVFRAVQEVGQTGHQRDVIAAGTTAQPAQAGAVQDCNAADTDRVPGLQDLRTLLHVGQDQYNQISHLLPSFIE